MLRPDCFKFHTRIRNNSNINKKNSHSNKHGNRSIITINNYISDEKSNYNYHEDNQDGVNNNQIHDISKLIVYNSYSGQLYILSLHR